jgi:cytochrome d ubiquinol oxidase subunit I
MIHLAFDLMVGVGSALIGLGAWYGIAWWRRRDIPQTKWFLRAVAISGIATILAMESGWIVTEVGRQPWVVQGIMRTKEAVTGASGVWLTFSIVLVLYTVLGVGTVLVLRSLARRWREQGSDSVDVPYGPREDPPSPVVGGPG